MFNEEVKVFFLYFKYTLKHIIDLFLIKIDASGNPVTEVVQTVGVTDPSGNPVTGK